MLKKNGAVLNCKCNKSILSLCWLVVYFPKLRLNVTFKIAITKDV